MSDDLTVDDVIQQNLNMANIKSHSEGSQKIEYFDGKNVRELQRLKKENTAQNNRANGGGPYVDLV